MTIIHKSPLPDVEIADVSITDYVLRKADDVPDKAAFIDGATGRVITFSELKDQVQRFAGGLATRGFGVGSTLALVLLTFQNMLSFSMDVALRVEQ